MARRRKQLASDPARQRAMTDRVVKMSGEGAGPGLLDFARTPQRKGASAMDHLHSDTPSPTSRTPYKPPAAKTPGARRARSKPLNVSTYPKNLQAGTAALGALLARRSDGQ